MTDKEIIEAWFRHPNTLKTEGDRFVWFAREIGRLAREECASLCDERASECNHTWTIAGAKSCAVAIRAMED